MPWGITAEDMARLAAIDTSNPPLQPLPQISRSVDKETWHTDFTRWAETCQDLVDTLHARELRHIIEAASPNNIDHRLDMLARIYQHVDSNQATIEALTDMIEVLETEIGYLEEHIGKSISEFVFSSPKLVDEYITLERHARNTTSSAAHIAAIMTWYHDWPAGFAFLLRIHAVHIRRVDNLKSKRDLISSGCLDFKQFPKVWSVLLWDDNSCGLADFRPPRLTKATSDQALQNRRYSALARLAIGRAGISDFLAPSYVDTWYHSFRRWLDHTRWIDVGKDLEVMHHRWTAEAEYQGPRVLTTKHACFYLSKDKRILREFGEFNLPVNHTPLCVEID
ncbi:hypothetical protein M438DRAFT_398618 [Aureobasidium pullulans EXF-150]|uniref:Uncharacterized protein n=1 Tax=Aureobasidium pullulans EXF-150 TaxID=1043002 RepID=A0A074X984_AURPU|nr:uncharacterized protein M438DRAFT_398618 [Aureobasidium pullulans EXF-150]KEQ82090.1 hypothetical protein M438DRAFT_398618 [Aureobasidium pullulans EXF-150]